MSKVTYSERETRMIIAWTMITFGSVWFINWSMQATGMPRPPYIIDLALPMVLMAVGAYMLRKKIPEA